MSSEKITSPFLDSDEAAAYLKMKKSTLYQWTMRSGIRCRKHGNKLVFLKEDLDAWSLSRVKKPKEPVQSKFEQVRKRIRSLKTECAASP